MIYKEEGKVVKGQFRTFEYKLLNYLIQGSAADQTKETIIDWDEGRSFDEVFMATVHDENNISAPIEHADEASEYLRISMEESCNFDVPFKTDEFRGPSWGEVKKYA